jgi:hypothetical protein
VFDAFCTACSRRQLIFPGQVLGIVNDGDGIHVVFRCSCRETGIWTTGRRPEQVPAAA